MKQSSITEEENSYIMHLACHAAVCDHVGTGYIGRFRRNEEKCQTCHILRSSNASDGMLRMIIGVWSVFFLTEDFFHSLTSIHPGLMQLTRTSAPRLMARACVRATIPPLDAARPQYGSPT